LPPIIGGKGDIKMSKFNSYCGYDSFKEDEVFANDVADYLAKHYKADRYTGRGEKYAARLLKSYQRDFDTNGYCHTSKHDSVSGRVISFYGRKNEGEAYPHR
jgi:hypothetical protein